MKPIREVEFSFQWQTWHLTHVSTEEGWHPGIGFPKELMSNSPWP